MKYLLILIIFIFGCSSAKEGAKTIEYIKKDTINIDVRPNIIYKDDTILTHSFIYQFDTILVTTTKYNNISRIKNDTIKIRYEYPENNLKLKINSTPDTIFSIVKEKSIFTTTEKILTALLIVLFAILIIALITKRV